MRAALLGLLLVTPLFAGCTLVPDAKPQDLSGTVEGYDPTASHLKVHLRVADRLVLADFDRRDWNVAGIAKMIDEKRVQALSVHGMPREVLNEVLVETVGNPSELAKFRWNDQTTPEERSAADQAYDALVAAAQAHGAEAPTALPATALPTVALP